MRSKLKILTVMSGLLIFTGCGGDSSANVNGKTAQSDHKSISHGVFKSPFQCSRVVTKKSKRTGEDRTLRYISFFHPQKDWRIDFTAVPIGGSVGGFKPANLYTPEARYDGTYKAKDGTIQSVKFATKWYHTHRISSVISGGLKKYKKKNCKALSDTTFFDIDYLDTLEVMSK